MTSTAAPRAPASERRGMRVAPYDHLDPAERFLHATRDAALLPLLNRHGYTSLEGHRVLELGCGEGSFLRSLLHYGAEPQKLAAVDVDGERVRFARTAASGAGVARADATSLPYADGTFDLAFAFTFLTSVVDPAGRRACAREAMRVLEAGGLLVVYDFQLNPLNSAVRPLPAGQLRALFAPFPIEIERITLAPPIVRALGGRSVLCRPLERLPFLRTHLLAAIVKGN